MSDLIDRQQTLDALIGAVKKVGILDADDIKAVFDMLPTIQPIATDTNVGDTISRQWLLDCINDGWIKFDTDKDANRFIHLVRDIAPTLQPEPHEGHWIPKEGYWIKYDERFPWRHIYKCSKCGNYLDFSGVNGSRGGVNFCPNCGAKMKGAQNG